MSGVSLAVSGRLELSLPETGHGALEAGLEAQIAGQPPRQRLPTRVCDVSSQPGHGELGRAATWAPTGSPLGWRDLARGEARIRVRTCPCLQTLGRLATFPGRQA